VAGPREQLNQVTSFLDASVVYGGSRDEASLLRTFSGGRLKTQTGYGGRDLLPADDVSADCRLNGTNR
jgi:hypothetical protein